MFVLVITTAQLHSTKPELRFCTGSNPTPGVSEIRDEEDLWQWFHLEMTLNFLRRSEIIHQTILQVPIFCVFFHESLFEWNNKKLWETSTILVNIAWSYWAITSLLLAQLQDNTRTKMLGIKNRQLIGSLSKTEFAVHAHLTSKSWHLWISQIKNTLNIKVKHG